MTVGASGLLLALRVPWLAPLVSGRICKQAALGLWVRCCLARIGAFWRWDTWLRRRHPQLRSRGMCIGWLGKGVDGTALGAGASLLRRKHMGGGA